MKVLHYNVTGQDRKELVGIISKVVGMKAVYKFMPTCAFVISNIRGTALLGPRNGEKKPENP